MGDIVWGLVLLGVCTIGSFALGCRLGRTLPVWLARWLGVATTVATAAYIAFVYDDVVMAKLLPLSNLIVVGNWIPPLTGLLAGLAWSLIPRPASAAAPETSSAPPLASDASGDRCGRSPDVELLDRANRQAMGTRSRTVGARRLAVVLSLQALGWLTVFRPLWGSAPRCHDRWDGDFCVQTTDWTCTAACAATLLEAHGIRATEQEMAELCLTRAGTQWQGLYRGLKLKTASTPWDVEVVHGGFDRLRALHDGPAILAAGVPRGTGVARIYTERYGWTPGEWHSVLFFGFRGNGLVAMGDPTPSIGRENWSEDDLRVLWRGRGMRLIPRGSSPFRDLTLRLPGLSSRLLSTFDP
jgi:hypothetical protein